MNLGVVASSWRRMPRLVMRSSASTVAAQPRAVLPAPFARLFTDLFPYAIGHRGVGVVVPPSWSSAVFEQVRRSAGRPDARSGMGDPFEQKSSRGPRWRPRPAPLGEQASGRLNVVATPAITSARARAGHSSVKSLPKICRPPRSFARPPCTRCSRRRSTSAGMRRRSVDLRARVEAARAADHRGNCRRSGKPRQPRSPARPALADAGPIPAHSMVVFRFHPETRRCGARMCYTSRQMPRAWQRAFSSEGCGGRQQFEDALALATVARTALSR